MNRSIFLLLITGALAQDCTFERGKDSPVITNDDFTYPDSLKNIYALNELFYITCPQGTSNAFISEEGEHVMCKGYSKLTLLSTSETLDFSDLKCTPKPKVSVNKLNETCENNGTMFEIGLKLQGKIVSPTLVCFNEKTLAPFYTKFKSRRPLYEDLVCGETRTCTFTDNSGLYYEHHVHMDLLYHDQIQILENLGVSTANVLVPFPLDQTLFAVLVQDVEGYSSLQYIQTIPIWWNQLNQALVPDWFNAYNDIDSTFQYVGTLDVATLLNANLESVEIYLSGTQIPVPKWVWAVDESNQLIFFNYLLNDDSVYSGDLIEDEALLLCTDPTFYGILGHLFPFFACYFENIIHPEMAEFVRNKF